MERKTSTNTQDFSASMYSSTLKLASAYKDFLNVFNLNNLKELARSVDSFSSISPGASVLELEENIIKNNIFLLSLLNYSKEKKKSLDDFILYLITKIKDQVRVLRSLSKTSNSYYTSDLAYTHSILSLNDIEKNNAYITLNDQLTLPIKSKTDLKIRSVFFSIDDLSNSDKLFPTSSFAFVVSETLKSPSMKISIELEKESLLNHICLPLVFNGAKTINSITLKNSQGQSVYSFDKRSLLKLIQNNPLALELILPQEKKVQYIDFSFSENTIEPLAAQKFLLSDEEVSNYKKLFLLAETYLSSGSLDKNILLNIKPDVSLDKKEVYVYPIGFFSSFHLTSFKPKGEIQFIGQESTKDLLSFKINVEASTSSSTFVNSYMELTKVQDDKILSSIKVFSPQSKEVNFPVHITEEEFLSSFFFPVLVSDFTLYKSLNTSSPVIHKKIKDPSGYFNVGFTVKELLQDETIIASFSILYNNTFNYEYALPSIFGWYDSDLFFHFFKGEGDYNWKKVLLDLYRDYSYPYRTPIVDNISHIEIERN